ncbi:regulatory protein, luxR family [Agreia bicolorata]|uniref:Regulatory protein, luxR family n=3 Tax=Agreia bicolorata TaxID=110935 RepID=A0A1T4WRA5_9MICO|nr:regulatory protein, luxR family [Agreia bicolorata]
MCVTDESSVLNGLILTHRNGGSRARVVGRPRRASAPLRKQDQERTVRMVEDLARAAAREDWESVGALLKSSFCRYLYEDAGAVEEVLARAPDTWFEKNPRRALARAQVEAVRHSRGVVDRNAVAPYQAWVGAQCEPAPRDVLVCRLERLRLFLLHARYGDASNDIDATIRYVTSVPLDAEGMPDVMPAVLLGCGVGKLLAGELDSAASCFSETIRWASSEPQHPYVSFGRGHLALVHALNERYNQAAALLPEHFVRAEPGTVQHLREQAGLLARLLVSIGTLDSGGADEVFRQIDESVRDGELGWILLHAEAMRGLVDERPWPAAHRLMMYFEVEPRRTGQASFAGAVLRADLASLYQAAGDLRAADRVLGTAWLPPEQPHLVVTRARQAMLQGQPEAAMALLDREEATHSSTAAARFRASGAVLYASSEFALGERGNSSAMRLAASSLEHDGALLALMAAPPAIRGRLFALAGRDEMRIPQPWTFQSRVRLTPRELEIFEALRKYRAVKEIAAALHISPNTAKTHVRALYRKLGAHSREDALWIGRDLDI